MTFRFPDVALATIRLSLLLNRAMPPFFWTDCCNGCSVLRELDLHINWGDNQYSLVTRRAEFASAIEAIGTIQSLQSISIDGGLNKFRKSSLQALKHGQMYTHKMKPAKLQQTSDVFAEMSLCKAHTGTPLCSVTLEYHRDMLLHSGKRQYISCSLTA